jgi:hypothetical protein
MSIIFKSLLTLLFFLKVIKKLPKNFFFTLDNLYLAFGSCEFVRNLILRSVANSVCNYFFNLQL